jgi:hypothetical protein
MSKSIFLAGSMAMALALGSIVVPSAADAAMRHGGGGHGRGFRGGHYGHGGFYGHGGGYYGGYGYGGWCNPVRLALGLCYY